MDCTLCSASLETLAFIITNNGGNNEERGEIFMLFLLSSAVLQRWFRTFTASSGSVSSSLQSSDLELWCLLHRGWALYGRNPVFSQLCRFFVFIQSNPIFSYHAWIEVTDEHDLIFSSRQFVQFVLHWNSIRFPPNLCYFFMTEWRFQDFLPQTCRWIQF